MSSLSCPLLRHKLKLGFNATVNEVDPKLQFDQLLPLKNVTFSLSFLSLPPQCTDTFLPPSIAASVPQPTTDYAPLERPRATPSASATTSIGPPSGLPSNPDPTATDPTSTALLAAQALESSTPQPQSTEEPKPQTLIPHGSLQPLELAPSQTPTFEVNPSITHKDADGNDLFNIDIDSFPEGERNWRKSGVNLSDYFNYGMNEATWRNYVRKQRDMRESESADRNPFIVCVLLFLLSVLFGLIDGWKGEKF